MRKNKCYFYLVGLIFLVSGRLCADDLLYFCTAASSNYFPHLLNLIGSIHAVNFSDLGEIAVYDLGLTNEEKKHLLSIQKVSVHSLEMVHPELLRRFTMPNGHSVLGWFAWKPVAIKQALDRFPYVLWLDAGTTVLRPLNALFKYIQQDGYFICTIGNECDAGKYRHPVGWGAIRYVREKFDLEKEYAWMLPMESVMGGIIGVSQEGKNHFLMPMYEMSKDLRNYQDDGTTPSGWGTGRHDQVVLSYLAYSQGLMVFKQDYTQICPIVLPIEGKGVPLYITWDKPFVCHKTDIYSCRGDLYNKDHYYRQIRYKK